MYFADYLTIDINNIYTIKIKRLSHVYMYCVCLLSMVHMVLMSLSNLYSAVGLRSFFFDK